MIVDDEPDVRESLDMILSSEGYDVTHADDGETFLGQLDEKPDLVILDVMMPGITTHEILSSLEKQKKKPKIVILTALRIDQDEIAAIKQYPFVVDYLEKPLSKDSILKVVKTHLRV